MQRRVLPEFVAYAAVRGQWVPPLATPAGALRPLHPITFAALPSAPPPAAGGRAPARPDRLGREPESHHPHRECHNNGVRNLGPETVDVHMRQALTLNSWESPENQLRQLCNLFVVCVFCLTNPTKGRGRMSLSALITSARQFRGLPFARWTHTYHHDKLLLALQRRNA